MYKVSELISKPLLSIYGAKNCGVIGNVYFDAKISRGKILSLFTEDDNDVDVKYVDMKKIVSVDHDAATIKNCDCLTYEWNTLLTESFDNIKINPINSDVYNQDGKFLGVLNDIILDGVKVLSFEVGGISYDQIKFVSLSDTILILNDTDKPIKLVRPSKIPKTSTDSKVEITSMDGTRTITINSHMNNNMNINSHMNGGMDTNSHMNGGMDINSRVNGKEEIKSSESTPVELPNKIPQSSTLVTHAPVETTLEKYSFLMGKRLNANIYDNHGILFNANTLIDDSVISAARTHGKLVQLALHATSDNI